MLFSFRPKPPLERDAYQISVEKASFFFSFAIDDRNNFDRSQFYSNTTSGVTEKSIEKQRGPKHVYEIQNIHQRVKTLYN